MRLGQNRREANLSLLDAFPFDVKESYELDVQLKEFESGQYKGGSGPRWKKSNMHKLQT